MTTTNDATWRLGDSTPKISIITRQNPKLDALRADQIGASVAAQLAPDLGEILHVLKLLTLTVARNGIETREADAKEARQVALLHAAARAISGRDDLPLPEGPVMPFSPERKVELLQKATEILADPQRAFSLRHCPPARPTAEFSATVLETIEEARQRLGGLPRFVVHFRAGSDQTPRGEAGVDVDGALGMWLDVKTPIAELKQTVAHECRHLVDLASGERFTFAQLERRAADFAAPFASE